MSHCSFCKTFPNTSRVQQASHLAANLDRSSQIRHRADRNAPAPLNPAPPYFISSFGKVSPRTVPRPDFPRPIPLLHFAIYVVLSPALRRTAPGTWTPAVGRRQARGQIREAAILQDFGASVKSFFRASPPLGNRLSRRGKNRSELMQKGRRKDARAPTRQRQPPPICPYLAPDLTRVHSTTTSDRHLTCGNSAPDLHLNCVRTAWNLRPICANLRPNCIRSAPDSRLGIPAFIDRGLFRRPHIQHAAGLTFPYATNAFSLIWRIV